MRLNFVKTDTCFLKPILKKFISELWVINLSHWKATKVITSTLYYQFFFFSHTTGPVGSEFPNKEPNLSPWQWKLGISASQRWEFLRIPLIWVTSTLMLPCENILFKVTFSQKVSIQNISEIYFLLVCCIITIIIIITFLLG